MHNSLVRLAPTLWAALHPAKTPARTVALTIALHHGLHRSRHFARTAGSPPATRAAKELGVPPALSRDPAAPPVRTSRNPSAPLFHRHAQQKSPRPKELGFASTANLPPRQAHSTWFPKPVQICEHPYHVRLSLIAAPRFRRLARLRPTCGLTLRSPRLRLQTKGHRRIAALHPIERSPHLTPVGFCGVPQPHP